MSSAGTAYGPGPSTVLWATASKEWIIPPKPKPGRKPKKDGLVVSDQSTDAPAQVDTKGRRVQNRAAQKAFRERKQTQLAELQARIEKYEQGEIERTAALQSISKRLKEENEKLRAENDSLRERIAQLERESYHLPVDSQPVGQTAVKRTRAGPTSPVKRARTSSPPPSSHALSPDYVSTPPSMAHSPDTSFSLSPEPPMLSDYPNQNDAPSVPAFDCGFCNEDTPCVCREIAMQAQGSPAKTDDAGIIVHAPPPLPLSPPSILDNLPAFQPAIPLRRNISSQKKAPVFKIIQTPTVQNMAMCSGDPNNCSACQGDSFGQAFCAAVGESVAAMTPSTSTSTRCADCPGDCDKAPSSSLLPGSFSLSASTKTIPMNAAWHQFKSHPNVSFADLSMLADVVARRSKCMGPTVTITPAPGSMTPERDIPDSSLPGLKRETRSPPPRLVPEEVLIECGRRRVREVEVSTVNQALRMLDTKYGSL